MKHKLLTVIFFLFLPFAVFCQSSGTKKVAVLDVVDKEGHVDYATKLMLRSTLAAAITNTPGYEGYDRVDISQIMGEQNFQRTGMVSDDQIKKLGEMTGASYILVAQVAEFDAKHLVITAKIIEVESAKVEHTADEMSGTTAEEFEKACIKLAASLFHSQDIQSDEEIKPLVTYSDFSDTTIQVNEVSFKMIYIKGGTFNMGATSEQESDPYENESPVHQVTLSGYYICEYEVTQKLWHAVMGNNPSYNKQGGNYPVEQVSYSDIQKFLLKLNQITGKTFDLPTEAQWEYAARGGDKSKGYKYSGGNDIEYVSWYNDNSNSTHPVGLKQSNELGIYDMSGNVCEWCSDKYGLYDNSSQQDPIGALDGSTRVLRGGSCNNSAISCRVSYRGKGGPDNWNRNNGFRIVMSLN